MAYQDNGGLSNFFVPNIPLATTNAGVMQEIDIGATGADHGEYICIKPCTVRRFLVIMTGEVAGGTSVPPQVLFKKRPTPLSATGETTVGTINVPDATAVGKVVFDDVNVDFAVGDSLEISHVIGTGTPTGLAHVALEAYDDYEAANGNTDMIETL